MNDQQTSLPTVPENESYQAGSLSLPVNKPTGKVFLFMNGWIKLHRGIRENWIWKDPVKFQWWVDILLEVNHKEKPVCIKGKLYKCERGQSVRSVVGWAKRWGVDRGRVQRFMDMLETDTMITLKSDSKTSILTVCNYELYQGEQTSNDTANTTTNTTTNKHQTHINKKEKNVKNEKNVIYPSIEEVKTYFKTSGYSEQSAIKFFNYYSTANWEDGQGKKVRNWKQKAQGVWFKDENKINEKKESTIYKDRSNEY